MIRRLDNLNNKKRMTKSKPILRHILATISYRVTKALHEVEPEFLTFQAGNGVRQPIEIVHHMSVVMTFCIAEITQVKSEKLDQLNTDEEIARFFQLLKNCDKSIEESNLPIDTSFKLVQGPLADVLTHVGQIAMLRRLYNRPIAKENFMKAKIVIGNVDRDSQTLENS
jgi:hypothetical protein